uniref:Uncharacterized protein n=1 Tax=Oryza brachyantha TaxID=4533 RepID=J3L7A0_ORYBR
MHPSDQSTLRYMTGFLFFLNSSTNACSLMHLSVVCQLYTYMDSLSSEKLNQSNLCALVCIGPYIPDTL